MKNDGPHNQFSSARDAGVRWLPDARRTPKGSPQHLVQVPRSGSLSGVGRMPPTLVFVLPLNNHEV